MYNVILCIIIMAIVSYIPRAVPITYINKEIKNRFVISFLYYVPYAVLSALTFPSIFFCVGNVYLALFGTLVALFLSYKEQELYVVAIITVLLVYAGFLLIG